MVKEIRRKLRHTVMDMPEYLISVAGNGDQHCRRQLVMLAFTTGENIN